MKDPRAKSWKPATMLLNRGLGANAVNNREA